MASAKHAIGHVDLLPTLKDLLPGVDEKRIQKALNYASHVYGDHRLELLPNVRFLDHAVETASFLAEFCRDEDAIIASILQHALKCPDGSLTDIGKEFGRGVRDIVSRIHLLSHLYTTDWRKSVEDMRIMLVSVADDVRVLLISLSVACVFADFVSEVKSDYRVRLSRQSLHLFAPVAARLGIYALKYRLERTAFPLCYPTDAQLIDQQLERLHREHGNFLNDTGQAIKQFLAKNKINVDVVMREKQPYSIFQKMRSKSVTALEKITDLFAIRVIVPEAGDCYQALGLLHQLAMPVSHRFKDYISFPKPNGYQSLHTSLIGLPNAPKDVIVEVQIRTPEMHREAEYGVAAHWTYKSQPKGKVIRSAQQFQLADVLLKQESVGNKSGDIDDELTLVDHIYVLTPRGDIIELPDGGTPLDFAFILHTDLGLKFKAARVNGSIVPISYKLENGDVVEILSHKHPRPALQWLEELVTPSARSKLKAYFFAHNRPQFLLKGRDFVNAELRTRGRPVLDAELSILATFDGKPLSVKEREDLIMKVGMGSIRTSSILRHLPEKFTAPRPAVKSRGKSKTPLQTFDVVAVQGQRLDMPYKFAKCCNVKEASPRPEKIVGIVTRGGSLSVHRDGCHMAKAANPERKVKMKWM